MDPVIEARNIAKVYGTPDLPVHALRGTDLQVEQGSILAIMGPSGSGKSTLLQLLGGLDVPSSGEVFLEGVNLAQLDDDARARLRRQRVGFIFQSFNLLPALTVSENVALPLLLDGVTSSQAAARALTVLTAVGLEKLAARRGSQLSGGEQQRVAIARGLVIQPAVLLADEPTGNLDSANANRVLDILEEQLRQHGQTAVLVTHDPAVARRADRIVHVLDGRIVTPAGKPA